MLLDQMSDNRKTPTNKLLIIGLVLIVALVLLGIIGYLFTFTSSESDQIKITIQENFYGIGGKILEVHDSSIIFETVAIPYDGSNTSSNDRWVWTVSINSNTEIVALILDENTPESAGGEDSFIEQAASFADLNTGDPVVITSSSDIKKQFSLNDKRMTASKIEIYP